VSDENENTKGLFEQFTEFMEAKAASEAENAQADDEVEIWDKDGRGARVKRSMAKPFLQSLGIDLDPAPETNDDGKGDGKGKARPTGKTAQNVTGATNVAKRYFSKPSGK
jgi:hypothetical protein